MNRLLQPLKPDEIVNSIHEIDFARLKKGLVQALILDIDDTLIPRNVNEVTPEVFEWVAERKAEGFKLFFASNSRHPERVKYIGRTLEVPTASLSFKPLPFGFMRALSNLGVEAKNAAMIGDQLFMDILGANLLGIYSIYTKHLTPETFPPRIWMRQAEAWILSKITPGDYSNLDQDQRQ